MTPSVGVGLLVVVDMLVDWDVHWVRLGHMYSDGDELLNWERNLLFYWVRYWLLNWEMDGLDDGNSDGLWNMDVNWVGLWYWNSHGLWNWYWYRMGNWDGYVFVDWDWYWFGYLDGLVDWDCMPVSFAR